MSMSPESRTDNPAASIHENHWCEHPGCSKWGCYGFARSKAEKPTWHCSEHYPHKPFGR